MLLPILPPRLPLRVALEQRLPSRIPRAAMKTDAAGYLPSLQLARDRSRRRERQSRLRLRPATVCALLRLPSSLDATRTAYYALTHGIIEHCLQTLF